MTRAADSVGPRPQSYTVVGAGAIGGTLAAYLAKGGATVTVIDTDAAHIMAIQKHGLTIEQPEGRLNVPLSAVTPEQFDGHLTAVLLAVKAQATDQASAWIAERLSPDGWVVSLQNGLNEALIASHVGESRTVAAFVDLFADVVAPGVIKDGGAGGLALGDLKPGASPRVNQLAYDLRLWGQPIVTDNVVGYLWAKLAFGTMLVATALADEDMHVLIDRHRPAMHGLASEVIAVADAEEITLEGFDAFKPASYREDANAEMRETATDALVEWLSGQSKKRSGIWRDMAIRGRKTEVPTHYEPVIDLARKNGINTPLLDRLIEQIRFVEIDPSKMSETLINELDQLTTGSQP